MKQGDKITYIDENGEHEATFRDFTSGEDDVEQRIDLVFNDSSHVDTPVDQDTLDRLKLRVEELTAEKSKVLADGSTDRVERKSITELLTAAEDDLSAHGKSPAHGRVSRASGVPKEDLAGNLHNRFWR